MISDSAHNSHHRYGSFSFPRALWQIEEGEEKIAGLLDQAQALLDTPSVPRDGYYAFVCEKCAPAFGYYGYFLAEQDLMKRAEEIYKENKTGKKP